MRQRLSFSLNLKTAAGAIGGLVLLSSSSTFLLNSGKSQTPNFDIFSLISSTISSNLGTTKGSIETFFASAYSGSVLSFLGNFSSFKGTATKYWSEVSSFFEKGVQEINSFLQKIPQGFETIYEFIFGNIGAFWNWIESGWGLLFTEIKKINEHFKKVKSWFSNGEFQRVLDLYQKQFTEFFKDPKQKLSYFFYNFYRVTFKFFFPWSWAFLEEGIASEKGLKELWAYFKNEKNNFKDDLKEFFKFFRKYQVQLENMSHDNKRKLVKQLLEKPEQFFKGIKKLNEMSKNNNLNDLNVLNLIGKDEDEVEKEIKKHVAKTAVKDVAKNFIDTGEKIASGIESFIFAGKETDKKISKALTKIIEDTTSKATDLVFDLFGGFFGKSKKKE